MVVAALVVTVVVLGLLVLVAYRGWHGNPQAEVRQRASSRTHGWYDVRYDGRYDGGTGNWGGGSGGSDGGSACGDGGGGGSC